MHICQYWVEDPKALEKLQGMAEALGLGYRVTQGDKVSILVIMVGDDLLAKVKQYKPAPTCIV